MLAARRLLRLSRQPALRWLRWASSLSASLYAHPNALGRDRRALFGAKAHHCERVWAETKVLHSVHYRPLENVLPRELLLVAHGEAAPLLARPGSR